MNRLVYFVPLVLLLVIGGFAWFGLGKDPAKLPSMLIDRQVPEFDLAQIEGYDTPGFASADLKGQVTLVNIFGSWCIACIQEHPFLMRLKTDNVIPIYGIDWRDKPDDAKRWLGRHGDPYHRIGFDGDSKVAISFGVTGAPESFIVDKQGVVRFKYIGPLEPTVWNETLLPIIEELRAQ
ncbi:MAG: DsbE family thiol:disulfide interchange protein [Magnetospiraceae bacterium]